MLIDKKLRNSSMIINKNYTFQFKSDYL